MAPVDGWVPTTALGRAIGFTAVLVLTAAVAGRFDLVLLAVPFGLGTALSLARRPSSTPAVQVTTVDAQVVEGGRVDVGIRLDNPDRVGYDLAVVRLARSSWLRVRHADRAYATPVPAGSVADIDLAGPALRWGVQQLGPAAAYAVGCDGLMLSPPAVAPAVGIRVYPAIERFDAAEAMPRAAGLVGQHPSRRPGEGGELAGVRLFTAGDRLRRIDWRTTLRTQQPHVVATLSDRDAEVVLLVDVLHEAGRSGGLGGASSVLDTSVRAAAAVAEHYLHRGDRVSMLEYGFRARRLRPGSGRRQYLMILEWLLDVRARAAAYEPSAGAFGMHLLSATALVVVLTPLLDARSANMIARLARSGRFVIAVDTLPPGVRPVRRDEWSDAALRLFRLERENTIGHLREHGVPVVTWAGAGSLDQVLRDIARSAGTPKSVRR